MKKLAIISSYNESCGNAAFTRFLKDSIEKLTPYSVDVIPLDLNLLQSTSTHERKLADLHVENIAKQLKAYNAVNIQLESVLFGLIQSDVIKRVKSLALSNKNTSLALHSPRLINLNKFTFKQIIKALLSFKILSGLEMLYFLLKPEKHVLINRKLLSLLTKNKCRLITHTIRAKKQINAFYDYTNVDVHPLVLVEEEIKINPTTLMNIKKGLMLEKESVIVGMFGYLTLNKGHTEAIEAMKHLPDNYKLLIFGRQHPQTIRSNRIDDYLNLLISKAKSPKLKGRVFFLGELSDEDLISIASTVDVVWLPYYENGQDGSGIASITFNVAKRILASSSFAFDEYLKLIPNTNVMRFDIGNYLEMAAKTKLIMSQDINDVIPRINSTYNAKTQAEIYTKELR